MEVLVLDTDLNAVAVVDTFESLIWTDRYLKCGDFEIYTSVNSEALTLLKEDYYLWLSGSDHVMIIEDLKISTNVENGNYLTITGRSLESILDRRIVWAQTILNGNLQTGIQQILNENVINPTVVERKIDNVIFEASTDPLITTLTIKAQYQGEFVYDVIQKLCETNNIGFKITLTDDNKFKFKLYSGADRSYGQLANPYVIFSPKFENLINSNYVESKRGVKTVALVGGEGEGSARKMATSVVSTGGGAGLTRRELFTESSISSTIDGGTLPLVDYTAQLVQNGVEELSKNVFISSFEGQIENTQMFTYGEDFFMGDIVQIANAYGMETKSRVTELIHSQNMSGTDVYPTFTKVI